MLCTKCSAQLNDSDKFCTSCGQPTPDQTAVNPTNIQTIDNIKTTFAPQPVPQPIQQNSNPAFGQPQSIFNQQSVPTQTNTQPMISSKQKSNKLPIIIAAIIGVAMITTGVIIAPKLTSSTKTNTDNTQKAVVTGAKVRFDNYTITVPESLKYDVTSSGVVIGDNDETWQADIVTKDGAYTNLIKNKDKLSVAIEKAGAKAANMTEKTISGAKVFAIEVTEAGTNYLFAAMPGSSSKVFMIQLQNLDGSYDYKSLESIISILKDATYETQTASTNMKSSNINLSQMAADSAK